MNVDTAKKILGLVRQREALGAAVRRGSITEAERAALAAHYTNQIDTLRAQSEFDLKPKNGADLAPKK